MIKRYTTSATQSERSLRGRLFWRIPARLMVLLLGLSTAGCAYIAEHSAPEKQAQAIVSPAAREAKSAFRQALLEGSYDRIEPVATELTGAYLENPRDPELALLLGMAHLWKVAESTRAAQRSPRITDHLVLAEKYLHEAYVLNPDDKRILGWLGGARSAIGSVHQDERLKRNGYFTLKEGVSAFPEFNEFSFAYVLSRLPASDELYQEALAAMWRNVDLCAGQAIDRQNPDFSALMRNPAEMTGAKRVCVNSALAPHNFEGFALAMGDMLVKNGQPEVAAKIYAQAKIAPSYADWPYRAVLEANSAQAAARARAFAAGDTTQQVMSVSAHACGGCHSVKSSSS